MTRQIEIHPCGGYNPDYPPTPPSHERQWWGEDPVTKGHARFCLPLLMANKIGFYLRSPCDFEVEWSGREDEQAHILSVGEWGRRHQAVTNHSACGSFTVQSRVVLRTDPGIFAWVKPIPNQRQPFTPMEGLIEGWWNPAEFGIVCLLNAPGRVRVEAGQPLAQVVPISQEELRSKVHLCCDDSGVDGRREFTDKRNRQVAERQGRVLDYMKGKWPDGSAVDLHFKASDVQTEIAKRKPCKSPCENC